MGPQLPNPQKPTTGELLPVYKEDQTKRQNRCQTGSPVGKARLGSGSPTGTGALAKTWSGGGRTREPLVKLRLAGWGAPSESWGSRTACRQRARRDLLSQDVLNATFVPQPLSLEPFSELSHAALPARLGLITLVGTEGGRRRAPVPGTPSIQGRGGWDRNLMAGDT